MLVPLHRLEWIKKGMGVVNVMLWIIIALILLLIVALSIENKLSKLVSQNERIIQLLEVKHLK